jgi:phytoene desaturase (3,4-didehydrolycopene-forming)
MNRLRDFHKHECPTNTSFSPHTGAGVGGISTAARLAKAGFSVTVLEKNDFTGGRCSLLHASGHRFDQGPSLLLLPRLFHQTFAELDTSLEAEGVKLVKCEPNYNIWFGDGGKFELSSDLAVMKREVERWEGREGYVRYLQFLQESHAHYELSVDEVLLKNFTGLGDMLRWSFLKELFNLHPFESIYSRASRYFWSERLRRVFTFGSMYMGMSPFDAPGTYSLLQYTELAEGIWYPIGGFHAVVQALVGICERLGVDVRLSTPVKQILLTADGSRATGVQLESGEVLHADVIVNNSDLVYAYNNLLPKQTAYAEDLSSRPGSCSSISFYWGLSQTVPELQAHNIFLADEYRESFDSIFKRHLIPDQPSFYVNVPSRVDPSAAPSGRDTVVVLVPVGHLLPSSSSSSTPKSTAGGTLPTPTQDWPAMISLARRTILSTIAARTGADLTPLITHELTNDPTTWRTTFNLDKGAILGLSHSFFNVLCFRPSTRARRPGPLDALTAKIGLVGRLLEVLADLFRSEEARSVQGLYMVGASAHPGTGVPIVLAGGRLVAEQVLRDLGMGVPWTGKFDASVRGEGGKRDERLDTLRKPWWKESWVVLVLGLVLVALRTLVMGNRGW